MEFAIDQEVYDEHGFVDEDVAERYADELMERFAASPEAGRFVEMGSKLAWPRATIELGIREVDCNVYDMGRVELEELLLAVFPFEIPCSPHEAFAIILELHAFWNFVDREFDAPSARSCVELLETSGFIETLHRAIAEPGSFGFAEFDGGADPDAPDEAPAQREAVGIWKRRGDARKARRRKRKAQKRSRRRNR